MSGRSSVYFELFEWLEVGYFIAVAAFDKPVLDDLES
jgi:hypothetical protein